MRGAKAIVVSKNEEDISRINKVLEIIRRIEKEIVKDSSTLYSLVSEEKTPALSERVSNNLKVASQNMYKTHVVLKMGFPSEWIEEDERSVALKELSRDNNGLAIEDMMSAVCLPYLRLSEKIVTDTENILSISRNLKIILVEDEISDNTFAVATNLRVLSETLSESDTQ